jgi:hypothetical protein
LEEFLLSLSGKSVSGNKRLQLYILCLRTSTSGLAYSVSYISCNPSYSRLFFSILWGMKSGRSRSLLFCFASCRIDILNFMKSSSFASFDMELIGATCSIVWIAVL